MLAWQGIITGACNVSGFFNLLLSICFEALDSVEFMHLIGGNLTNFGRCRQRIRRFVIEHVLNDNSRPSSEGLFVLLHICTGRNFQTPKSKKK